MPSNTNGIRAGRAFVELFADDSKLVRGLRRAQKRLKAFGDRIRNLGLKMTGLGAAMLAPMLGAAKAFSSMGDQVAKMAKRTGLSVETLSELRFVASQTGTEFESLEMGFRKMQRSIYDAGRGLSTQVDALTDLGLQFEDLDGLSPEAQFKLIGEAIGRIEDPTKKAAIAMTLFGRTGTNLLPMFASGAKGIEQLQEEARRLGLTMSSTDAKAAEDFTDALDKLWKVVKMGVFRIGAALAPVLEQLADTVTGIMTRFSGWIDQNRQVIVSVLKVAAAVLVGGIAFVVFGTLISSLGGIIGAMIAAITTLGTVFSTLAGAIGFLLSPIGMVIAALASLGAYLVHTTNLGGKALAWLGNQFALLKDTALAAYRGIADALASGDIALAAKKLWLSLKLAWEKGIAALHGQAEELRFGLLALHEQLVAGLTSVWLKLWSALRKGWLDFKDWHSRQVESWANWLAKKWIDVQESTGQLSGEDAAFQRGHVDQQSNMARADLDRSYKDETRRIENEKNAALAAADEVHQQRMTDLADEARQRQANLEDDLNQARRQWRQALARARSRGGDGSAGPAGDNLADEIVDRANRALMGMTDYVADQAARVGVRGTFNASVVWGLGGGDAADRTAQATEETAKNTKKILQVAQDGNLAFG